MDQKESVVADWGPRLEAGLRGPAGLLVLILAVNAVGAAPALLAGPGTEWFAELTKPAIYPPPVVFGVVWTTLFSLQGVAVWLVVRGSEGTDRLSALALFGAQFFVNLAWTPTFFGLRAVGAALLVALGLVPLILVTIRSFARIDRRAGYLLVPYLVWAAFAVLLTYRFLVVN
ncbi:MAG: TspO/MBR family protein [Halobaculum sp.]